MRNVVTSGLSQGTIVVEASRTSGARMQARLAAEQGKRVWLLRSLVDEFEWAREFAERRPHEVRVVESIEDVLSDVVDADAIASAAAKGLPPVALYHRYHSQVNESVGVVKMSRDDIVDGISEETNVLREHVAAALNDITYSSSAREAGIEPLYFSLFALESSDSILMLPHHFAMWEGFVNVLRLTALRNPELFLGEISGPLGTSLVRELTSVFEAQGFQCSTDLSISAFGENLPDIDLAVVSEERTLGYVFLFCEVKAPIPSSWAKDYLRVLRQDSISKAFAQLDAIDRFLSTDEGIEFIRKQLPPEGLPDFGQEFIAAVQLLVATSDNAGMFFSDRNRVVLDFRTLRRLVTRSDGDMAFILYALRRLPTWADECLRVETVEVEVDGHSVAYTAAAVQRLLEFEQQEYRSGDVPELLLRGMLEEGGHPFDVLKRQGPSEDAGN